MTTASMYRFGAAALAFAGAVAMTPALAQADTTVPQAPSLTFSQTLGSAAGQEFCTITDVDCVVAALSVQPVAPTSGFDGIFKNNIIWSDLNALNPTYQNDPNTVLISNWTPLGIFPWIPTVFPALWTLWTSQTSETCVLGWSTSLSSPYGSPGAFTTQFNSKGCNP